MYAFEHLGLDDDADERAIKRAYAQRLKTVRPDVDPEGFQALHEAYRMALEAARWRDENPDDIVEINEAAPALEAAAVADVVPTILGAARPQVPKADGTASQDLHENPTVTASASATRFDFDTFYAQMVQQAGTTDIVGLQTWLVVQATHWSLQVKSEAGWRSLAKMRDAPPALTPGQFDALVTFFGFDDVLAGADPIALFHLRAAIEGQDRERRFRSELEPKNLSALTKRMALPDEGGSRAGYSPLITRFYMRLLRRRFAYWWAYPCACLPMMARRITAFIDRLCGGWPELLSPEIDARHVTFWSSAQRGQGTRISRSIFFVRALVFYSVVIGLSVLEEHGRSDRQAVPRVNPNASISADHTALGRDQDFELFVRGNALQANRQHQEALEIFDQILQRRPTDRQVWICQMMLDRIFALAGLRRYDEMVEAIDMMLARFGNRKELEIQYYLAQALYNKGASFLHEPDPARALAVFDEMLARFEPARSDDIKEWVARAHYYRGNMLLKLQRYQDAVAQFDTYLQRFRSLDPGGKIPRLRRAQLGKARALAGLGRRDDAIAVYLDLEARYGAVSSDAAALEVAALAQIERAGLLERREDAIAIYDALIQRLASHPDADIKAVVEKARNAKASAGQPVTGKK